MIAIGIFNMGWSIDKCLNLIHSLCRTAFPQRRQQGVWAVICAASRVMLRGGIYPPGNIENVLQKVFGNRLIDDGCCPATRYGVDIAFPVTEVPGAKRKIFTSYNRVGPRRLVAELKDTEVGPRPTPSQPHHHAGYTPVPAANQPCSLTLWQM